MKEAVRLVTFLWLTLFWLPTAGAQPATQVNTYHQWWRDRPFGRPFNNPQAKKLPRIQVKSSQFVDPNGKPVLFRGLSISDPDKIEHQGHWSKAHFEKVREMGTMLVRIPVHPVAWRERTPPEYLKLLDQAVQWCTELDMYLIIDWHTIGNLKMELFQDPMYDTTQKETFAFWRTIAQHFRGHNTVAFYELFNEPTLYSGRLGRMSWSEWKKLNEDMIALIRAYDSETIPLVAGLDWAYDLTPLHIEPLEAEGIGYVTHPYAHKRPKPWEPKWEEDFGFAAGRYPILATEFGLSLPKGATVKEGDYGKAIITYLEGKGIGWLGWVFDPEWGPNMLRSWDTYELTGGGEFFQQALQGKFAD
jgi:endoglucanase